MELPDEPEIMRRKITFKPELTFGGLLNIAVMIFIASGVYYTTRGDIASITSRIDKMEVSHENAHRDEAQKISDVTLKVEHVTLKVEHLETMVSDDRRMREMRIPPQQRRGAIQDNQEENQ